ncbi:MAG: hypothetical protein GXN96_00870 [Aquificae bacterium]|nr:hypothetical protein [Aquificota bacterium]
MELALTDYVAGGVFLLSLFFFLNPGLEKNRTWGATVTPLASIIGSGYLVSAPLLYFVLGDYAVLGMTGIVVLAYLIGEAIRYNILRGEPLVYGRYRFRGQSFLQELDRFSSLALAFAYMISVAFYLRLLSAFVFSGFLERNHLYENLFTSLLLLFIGVSGFLRGLDFLEFMEKYAVALKLSVIFSFLATLLVHDLQGFELKGVFKPLDFESLRILAGILLIVQGFETSKYLGEKYTPEERARSMKLAQLFSGFIYISFMLLVTPILYELDPGKVDETAIITLAASISFLLGYLIRLGPLMSQFSAAVADTAGAGGLIQEETRGRVSSRLGYLLVSFVGLILVWSVNIFEIIAYASKAFAFYYLLQVIFAFLVSLHRREWGYLLLFSVLIPVLTFITLAGKSAE